MSGYDDGKPERPVARSDIMRWRRTERERLIADRLALPAETRAGMARRIAGGLDDLLGSPAGRRASLYWPFRGEPDLRGWASEFIGRGGRVALPIVVARGQPLIFRDWRPGDRLERGIWNIPIPADGPQVVPDIVIAPLVGHDAEGYRLGYGGGFFDRTLAGFATRPLVVGVGYSRAAVDTIHPLPHDIPMTVIVTEEGRDGGGDAG